MNQLAEDIARADAIHHGQLQAAAEIVDSADRRYRADIRRALLAEIGRLLAALGIEDEAMLQRCRDQWRDADLDALHETIKRLRSTGAEMTREAVAA